MLRRIMRRAIQQGRALELEPGFLRVYADRVTELMGSEYLELGQQRDSIQKWLEAEEEGFGRTLEQGLKRLDELIERARLTGAEGIAAADAFLLHDTYGFPIDLTLELVAEQDLGVDEEGFEALMDEQRDRARASAGRTVAGEELRERALALADEAGFATDFVGYETTDSETTIGAVEGDNGRVLVKLVESPFYATGGGQVADSGYVECADGDCRARVDDVLRLGDDQVVAVVPERGTLEVGERVHAHVDRAARHATECNHTATHLLHAALRERLGNHVRQAGSYVGPDKLRFDFTHGKALYRTRALTTSRTRSTRGSSRASRCARSPRRSTRRGGSARWRCSARSTATWCGWSRSATAVLGGGGWAGSISRELCGGTHVHNTAEIGVFKIVSETSSAANVRRIEALTGPVASRAGAPARPGAVRGGQGAPRPARDGRRRRDRAPRAHARARARGAPGRQPATRSTLISWPPGLSSWTGRCCW